MKKKILSILLCSVITVTGAITANAAENIEKHNGFELFDETINIPDNVVMVSSYKIDDNSNYTATILNEKDEKFELFYKDCQESAQLVELKAGEMYWIGGKPYNFSNTGGTYRKAKIKISEFSDGFNEDGNKSLAVPSGEEFVFTHKDYSCEEYSLRSNLSCLSGGMLTKVYPDKNGEIDIYLNAEVGFKVGLIFSGSVSVKGDNKPYSIFGTYVLDKLTFGNVNGDNFLSVSDVTYLQMYLAGMKKLDSLGMYHADTNNDGVYDVKDVTHLQLGISKLKG